MLKKELAELIGVSPSMVSRLAKRGMPTDSLERAVRWRKRHLETGRTVDNKFDPDKPQPQGREPKAPPIHHSDPAHVEALSAPAVRVVPVDLGERLRDLARVAELLERRIMAKQSEFVGVLVERLRSMLRGIPAAACPPLSLCVWRELVWAVTVPPDPQGNEYRALVPNELADWLNHVGIDGAEILSIARDQYGFSIPGLHPEVDQDD